MLSIKWREQPLFFCLILVVFSLCLNLYIIQIHPFLHEWDERFHALVAKNLSFDLLKPMLYRNSPIEIPNESWAHTSIWLHKQPLFLWQMALSIRMFGLKIWAIRLPSVIMLSLLVFPIYRISFLISNQKTGFLAAFLTVTNWYILEHVDGYMGMDHNDMAFMFYVTFSIWSLMEYIKNPDIKFVMLIGLFSGCAMLNKWITGLVVFEGMFIYLLFFCYRPKRTNVLFHLALSLFIAFCVFLPWQIYTYLQFYDVAIKEWSYNQQHFTNVVEGHYQKPFFYFLELSNQFHLLFFFIPIGILLFFYKKDNYRFVMPLIAMTMSIYIFFTIAATKISSYTMVTMPIIFIFIAYAITKTIDAFLARNSIFYWFYPPAIIICAIINFNYPKLVCDYTSTGSEWFQKNNLSKFENAQTFNTLNKVLNNKTVIVGLRNHLEVDAMFYTSFYCYNDKITLHEIKDLQSKGYKIAAFKNSVPEVLERDKSVQILNFDIY